MFEKNFQIRKKLHLMTKKISYECFGKEGVHTQNLKGPKCWFWKYKTKTNGYMTGISLKEILNKSERCKKFEEFQGNSGVIVSELSTNFRNFLEGQLGLET